MLLLPALNNEKLLNEYCSVPLGNRTLDEMEKDALKSALKSSNENQVEAAKILGITQRQIGYKMKKYGI
jgi:Nif-specific regulatory protein